MGSITVPIPLPAAVFVANVSQGLVVRFVVNCSRYRTFGRPTYVNVFVFDPETRGLMASQLPALMIAPATRPETFPPAVVNSPPVYKTLPDTANEWT